MTVNCMEFNLPPSDGWRSESNTEQWKPLAPRSLCWFKPTPRQANHPSSQQYIITACDFQLIFFPSCHTAANCVIDEHQNNGQFKKNLFLTRKLQNKKLFVILMLVIVVSCSFLHIWSEIQNLQGGVKETTQSAQYRKRNTRKESKHKDYRKTLKTESKRKSSPEGEWHTCNTLIMWFNKLFMYN